MSKFNIFENAFKRMTLDDVEPANELYRQQGFRDCARTACVTYLWSDYLGTKIAFFEGLLYVQDKTESFYYPAGKADESDALKFLYDYCISRNRQLLLIMIPEPALEIIQNMFECEIEYRQDFSDYLYLAEDLKNLAGKKFHSQRNHLSAFKRNYPDYQYLSINDGNKIRAIEFLNRLSAGNGITADYEMSTAFMALQNLSKLDMFGAMIEAGGEIVALSMGEIMGDTLFVHYEKALKDIKGGFNIMTNEFIKHNAENGIVYVNREEDLGIEGLRKSKRSYNPIGFVNKYIIKVTGLKKN